MTRTNLPRCPYSDLERISCACPECETFTMTDTEAALFAGVIHIADLEKAQGRPLPQYRARTRPEPQPWQFGAIRHHREDPHGQTGVDPTVIDCDHPHHTGICDSCWAMLQLCLGDIPALVQDLNTTIVKDVKFVQHGHRKDDPARPDEAPIMVHLGASAALDRLAVALRTPPPANGWSLSQAVVTQSRLLLADPALRIAHQIADRAATISKAVVQAHRTIDRPPDWWFYGQCPDCDVDIIDERGQTVVACDHCGYSADLDHHHRAILASREDEKLTIDELVGVFTRAGQPITRQQIKNLVTRRGLPRERQAKPRWIQDRWGNMRIETSEVWVHRIGDVRDLLDELRLEAG